MMFTFIGALVGIVISPWLIIIWLIAWISNR